MAFVNKVDLGYSTVAVAPSPALSGTTLSVQTGDGAVMPTAPFYITVGPSGADFTHANSEIILVTNKGTGDAWSAITRAQRGTSARTILVGDRVINGIYVEDITAIENALNNTTNISFTMRESYKRFTIADAKVGATSKIWGEIMRGAISDLVDPGWTYSHNIVNRGAGTFDITVWVTSLGENADGDLFIDGAPNETLEFCYIVV